VENVQKRKTKRGKDFVMADFSDQSGQFSASCFEESMVDNFVQWAREGACVLLSVELDSPSPEEPPRVTVRGAQLLSEARAVARMRMTMEVSDPGAFSALAALLPRAQGAQGEVEVLLKTGSEPEPRLRLGRDFLLDGELVDALAAIGGVAQVMLAPARSAKANLRLVA